MNDYFGEYKGVTVSLTRWDDRYLDLNERSDFANARNCDLFYQFISIRPALRKQRDSKRIFTPMPLPKPRIIKINCIRPSPIIYPNTK